MKNKGSLIISSNEFKLKKVYLINFADGDDAKMLVQNGLEIDLGRERINIIKTQGRKENFFQTQFFTVFVMR